VVSSISQDPITNAINNGIRRSIDITIKNKCYRSTVILIYSGIDAMSYLARPISHEHNTSQDFKDWVTKYFHIEGKTKITSDEWWAARCGIIHTYTPFSKKHKDSNVRVLEYAIHFPFPIAYDAIDNPNIVVVNVLSMRDAFFTGIDKFLTDSFSNIGKKQLMKERLCDLFLEIPFLEL
jgi:hypothetical protein